MSAPAVAGSARDLLQWCDRAGVDPESALRRAKRWLSRAPTDSESRAVARHVAGVASIERGLVGEGRRHTLLGLAVARRLGMRDMEVRLRLTLAWAELERGRVLACQAQLRAVRPLLAPGDHAKAAWVRGMLHRHRGRHVAAVGELTVTVTRFESSGDRCWLALALLGRGLARLAGGWLDAADSDLARADRMFTAEGRHERAAYCRHNRGTVALRADRLSEALRLFSDAVATGLDDHARPEARAERAEALARVGRNAEARAELERAAADLTALGRTARLGEVRLALAECDLRDNALDRALESAGEARRMFRAQARRAWTARAVATWWRAKLAAGHRSRVTVMAAGRAAARCAAYGWTGVAADLWLAGGQAAADRGMTGTARRQLAAVSGYRRDRSLPVPIRATGWLGVATAAELDGDREQVLGACGAGLRLIAEHVTTVRAADVGVHAWCPAESLAEIALRAAVGTGSPDITLYWSERCRAGAWHRHDPQQTSGPELRRAVSKLRDAVAGASPHDSWTRSTGTGFAPLEHHVRDAAMLVDGPAGSVEPAHDPSELARQLSGCDLISFFVVDGQLHSVSIVDGEEHLARHGSAAEVGASVDRLRYCLQRQDRAADPAIVETFAVSARQASETLERALLPRARTQRLGSRPVVVVPTGQLHLLPWASLPLFRDVAVTVTPSIACWTQAREQALRGVHRHRQVWVAGPGPQYVDDEARALQVAAGGRLLTGSAATTARVLREVDGAATVHIAAHGWFRADHPLLSCVDLADGPLYGYDLDRLGRGPTTVVLSACEVGQSAVGRGEELSGLAAALLGRGTATVIASVVAVPDERTARVMVDLHAGLRGGLAPAAALAAAQQRHGESGFVCLGYGGGGQP